MWRFTAVPLLLLIAVPTQKGSETPTRAASIASEQAISKTSVIWRDSLRDGFPDGARLDRPGDRTTFVRWLTFLAESQFYQQGGSRPSPAASEIRDCAALIRFAFRNALVAHNDSWRQSVSPELSQTREPDFGDLHKPTYPSWILGAALFRTRPGPFVPADLDDGAFAQFADAATLLHYNTFLVSRDIHAAQSGDLLFYYQPGQGGAYHSMLFVGRSWFQTAGSDWVVYHTGDLDGRAGEVRETEVKLLMQHPDPRWRPLAANPRFLGVYRFELLR